MITRSDTFEPFVWKNSLYAIDVGVRVINHLDGVFSNFNIYRIRNSGKGVSQRIFNSLTTESGLFRTPRSPRKKIEFTDIF